jgi:hypothetical protein
MNDTALDEALRAGARVTDDEVSGWSLDGADDALLAGLVGGGVGRSAPRRRGRLLAMAASVLVVAAGFTGAAVAGFGPAEEEAYAAEVLDAAEHSLRLLVDDPAWRIEYVDETAGEMWFTNGPHKVQTNLYPLSHLEDRVRSTEVEEDVRRTPSRLLGGPAVTVRGRVIQIYAKVDDRRMLEVSLHRGSESQYDRLVEKLRIAPVRQWLDALPASVFSGDRRTLAIDGMLAGLPLPPGYDPRPLKRTGLVSDRYQLGVAVVQDVGCRWFHRWFDAREAGDEAAAATASRALRSSGEWRVLREMDAEGDYPFFFEQYAEATADGKVHGEGGTTPFTRKKLRSLGCEKYRI